MSLFQGLFGPKKPEHATQLTAEEKMHFLFKLIFPEIVRDSTFNEIVTTLFVLGRAHARGNPMYRASVANDTLKGKLSDEQEPFSFRYSKENNHVVLYLGGTDYVMDFQKHDSGYFVYLRNLMNEDGEKQIKTVEELVHAFRLSPWFKNPF